MVRVITFPIAAMALIYRGGGKSPSNFKLRPGEKGLSFRDSLSNPWPLKPGERPVFRPGDEYVVLNPAKIQLGRIIYDSRPPGHVTIEDPVTAELIEAIEAKGRFPK